MTFSAMTVSYPVDELTKNEIEQLIIDSTVVDHVAYDGVLNLAVAENYEVNGFFVLLYDDENDRLAGVASAVDMMGLRTYEWSLLVHPMYRNIGLGTALHGAIQKALAERQAAGQLALTMENDFGEQFLSKMGYAYSFSEATVEARAEQMHMPVTPLIRAYDENDRDTLAQVFCEAFGDQQDEALQLIEYNSQHEQLKLWVAQVDGQVIGTVTTRQEQDAQWITALAVHPQVEGQGIGSALLQYVKQLAFSKNQAYVRLDVEIENERALEIYKRNGFIKVAQIDYYTHN